MCVLSTVGNFLMSKVHYILLVPFHSCGHETPDFVAESY